MTPIRSINARVKEELIPPKLFRSGNIVVTRRMQIAIICAGTILEPRAIGPRRRTTTGVIAWPTVTTDAELCEIMVKIIPAVTPLLSAPRR